MGPELQWHLPGAQHDSWSNWFVYTLNQLLTFLKSASDMSTSTLQDPQDTSDSGNLRKTLGLPMAGNKKHPTPKHYASGSFLPSCFQNTTLPTDNVSTLKMEYKEMVV